MIKMGRQAKVPMRNNNGLRNVNKGACSPCLPARRMMEREEIKDDRRRVRTLFSSILLRRPPSLFQRINMAKTNMNDTKFYERLCAWHKLMTKYLPICHSSSPPCFNRGRNRRQNTAYADNKLNWVFLCDECAAENDEYWKERWDEYYSSCMQRKII